MGCKVIKWKELESPDDSVEQNPACQTIGGGSLPFAA